MGVQVVCTLEQLGGSLGIHRLHEMVEGKVPLPSSPLPSREDGGQKVHAVITLRSALCPYLTSHRRQLQGGRMPSKRHEISLADFIHGHFRNELSQLVKAPAPCWRLGLGRGNFVLL